MDMGAVGRDARGRALITEKELTLMIAFEAARLLRKNGVDVRLTRESDEDLDLPSRTAIANRWTADAFVSVHLNSAAHPRQREVAHGVETYVLNHTSDASSRRLAQLENSLLRAPGISTDSTGSTSSDVALMLKDVRLDSNLPRNLRLACALQGHLVNTSSTRLSDRGVKQAMFHVLLGADMPGALVEVGFLSHPRDLSYLLSADGRRRAGLALARAVLEFRRTRFLPASALPPRCRPRA